MSIVPIIGEIFMIAFGVFLVVDSLVLHLITFDYAALDLQSLDPILNHWMIGFGLILTGLYALDKSNPKFHKQLKRIDR